MNVSDAISQSANGRAMCVNNDKGYPITYFARIAIEPQARVFLNWIEDGEPVRRTLPANEIPAWDWQPCEPVLVGDRFHRRDGKEYIITNVVEGHIALSQTNHPDDCLCGGAPFCYTCFWTIGSLAGQGMTKI